MHVSQFHVIIVYRIFYIQWVKAKIATTLCLLKWCTIHFIRNFLIADILDFFILALFVCVRASFVRSISMSSSYPLLWEDIITFLCCYGDSFFLKLF